MSLTSLYREFLRISLNRKNKKRLVNRSVSILSSNCVGGVLYHDMGLEFKSPLINMYIETRDFIKLLKSPQYYFERDLIDISKDSDYPIAKCGDIVIHGLHYNDFEQLNEKWEIRKKRLDYNNLFIIMIERDGCTYDDIVEFDRLEYENKVVFVHRPMPEIKSAYYIKGTENVGDEKHKVISLTAYKNKFTGKRYIDDFDYVSFFNK